MKDRQLQKRFKDMLSWFGYAADTAGPELASLLNDTKAEGREEGAAVAFGIIGMFEALRSNPRTPLVVERHYWETDPRYYDCWCPGCGAFLKCREVGVDEGTYSEWCGLCRYG